GGPRAAAPPPMTAEEEAALAARVDRARAAELEAAWPRMRGGGAAAARVALRLARIAAHRGEEAAARRWLERAGGAPGAAELAAELERAARVDPALVAVLLPLSGPHGGLGRALRAAIEIAGARAGGRGARLEVLDTRGEEEEAARQVEAAAAAGAVILIGPVGQAEGRAAAARAAALGVPIALLAPGEGADPDAGVFRLMSSAEHEAAEAARLALERGHDRVAVLAPRDEQGAAQAAAFARAARAGGAELVASGTYEPTATDLEPDVKALLGLDPAHNQRLRAHLRRRGKSGWKTFSPDVPFDLLYIPDRHDRAALLASYLPYFNVEVRTGELMDTMALRRKHGGRLPSVVQLLGSSGWHHPGLLPRGGPAVEGALIAVPCAAGAADAMASGAGPEEAAAFAEAYEARTGRPPGPAEAQAA